MTWLSVTAQITYIFLLALCIFQEPKDPTASQDRLSHARKDSPLPTLPSCTTLVQTQPYLLAYQDLWRKTWVEQISYILLGFTINFILFSTVKLVPYITKPICARTTLCPSMPTPKRNCPHATTCVHIKNQKAIVIAVTQAVPASQCLFLGPSCRPGYYICDPSKEIQKPDSDGNTQS